MASIGSLKVSVLVLNLISKFKCIIIRVGMVLHQKQVNQSTMFIPLCEGCGKCSTLLLSMQQHIGQQQHHALPGGDLTSKRPQIWAALCMEPWHQSSGHCSGLRTDTRPILQDSGSSKTSGFDTTDYLGATVSNVRKCDNDKCCFQEEIR